MFKKIKIETRGKQLIISHHPHSILLSLAFSILLMLSLFIWAGNLYLKGLIDFNSPKLLLLLVPFLGIGSLIHSLRKYLHPEILCICGPTNMISCNGKSICKMSDVQEIGMRIFDQDDSEEQEIQLKLINGENYSLPRISSKKEIQHLGKLLSKALDVPFYRYYSTGWKEMLWGTAKLKNQDIQELEQYSNRPKSKQKR